MIDGISVSAAKNAAAPVSMPPVTQMIVTAETMHAKANAATARNSVVFQVGWSVPVIDTQPSLVLLSFRLSFAR